MSGEALSSPSAAEVPVYIIGLDNAYRGAALEQQLMSDNAHVRRHSAFDARHLSGQELATLADQHVAEISEHRILSAGEIGCAISHADVWRAAAESSEQWTVVFEDDARLTRHWPAIRPLLARMETSVPTVVLLYSQAKYSVTTRSRCFTIQAATGKIVAARAVTPPPGAAAYAMNRAAAQLASERSRGPVYSVADWPPWWAYEARFYFCFPWLAQPGDVVSTLNKDRNVAEAELLETRSQKVVRHLSSALAVRYLRNRRAYWSPWQFWRHEIVRPLLLACGRRFGQSVGPEAGPWML